MKPVIATFILVGAHLLVASCQSAESAKLSERTERKADDRRSAIQKEIDRIGRHPWAGKYYHGDGLGVNVSLYIAPTNGFAFAWHGCLGLYDQNYGSVSETNGALKLNFEFPNERRGFQGLATELVPVHWGPRTYLIASNEMTNFCNDINSGREPRKDAHGRHLLRDGDQKKKAIGAPDLPVPFQQYLLKQPITATVTAIGKISTRPSVSDWMFKDIEVTLNVGSEHGLRTGMALRVVSPGNAFDSVEITRVDVDQAFGTITQIGEDDPLPKVGWKFSTKR